MPLLPTARFTKPTSFNPRPALRPGDACLDWEYDSVPFCFNPRPALRPGDASSTSSTASKVVVFQSAPGLGAGRSVLIDVGSSLGVLFQSAPGLGAGRSAVVAVGGLVGAAVSIRARPWGRAIRPADPYTALGLQSFNPRPALGPGDPSSVVVMRLIVTGFQSAPGLGAGRSLHRLGVLPQADSVSIRARPWGRAIPA